MEVINNNWESFYDIFTTFEHLEIKDGFTNRFTLRLKI